MLSWRSFANGFIAVLLCGAAGATNAAPEWDVTNTGQSFRDIEFSTTEGTWMSVDVSPDGETIVFDLLDDIYVMPARGGEAKLLHGGPAMQRTPSFSPDGKRILYLSDVSGCDNIWISDVDGANARQVTHETVDLLMGPAWMADGRAVVASKIFSTFPKLYTSQIYVFDVAGENAAGAGRVLVDVPPSKRDVQEAALSQDGRYIYYTERLLKPNIYVEATHINYAIKRKDLSSGAIREMASGWGGAITPQVSHDGQKIAFLRRVRDKTVLFSLDTRTRAQRAVFDKLDRDIQADFVPQGNYYPHFSWFPDNRHVAIWAKGKLWKVDMESGAAREIPFRAQVSQRVTDPVRFRYDLSPKKIDVKAIRHLAVSTKDDSMIFTALGHLWRKAGLNSSAERLQQGEALSFEPSFSADGKRITYVEWNDQTGSALKVAAANGSSPRVIASSLSVIRQPQFSKDGNKITYRIQDADTSMGGARGKPGIYWVDAGGGASHFVSDGDDAPMFSPSGDRIFFIDYDSSGTSKVEVLRSVTLDGLDKRDHARTPDVDTSELRLSPDFQWLAFRDRRQYYLAPFAETGGVSLVSPADYYAPVHKLTDQGGYGLKWSADGKALYWVLGSQFYKVQPNRSGAMKPAKVASANLRVSTDSPSGMIAFTNARIITMRDEEVIERGTVLVSGNRIVEVGPTDAVVVPAAAKTIDASGKTIMPGLVDAHGHIDCCYMTGATPQKQPSRYAALAFGVTTNFDPYPNDLASYESTETTLTGQNVGPRWIGTGIAIYGRAQMASHIYMPINSYEDAQNILAGKVALGGHVIKSYKQPARYQRQMLVKAAREAGLNVAVEGESHFYNNITMVLDGNSSLEHNFPLATIYGDVVQFMALARAHQTPTLVVTFGELFGENYMYQNSEPWKHPKVRAFVQEVLSGYSPLHTPYGAPPHARAMTTIQVAEELWDIGFRAVARSTKKLDDAGVTINVGSHGEVPGLAMHWEMALLAEGGMSPMRVLRAATMNGAKTLGVEDQIGSLEPGKLADLIVLDKNPLESIRNSDSVRYTMVNGRLYDSLSMDEIGNYNRPRTKFYWELQNVGGIDWNEAWGGR
jgi:Tol biopolymer transport system component/dihydroorotase-like cyclic amidohydrolase